jgi:hypothetical protein
MLSGLELNLGFTEYKDAMACFYLPVQDKVSSLGLVLQ